MATFLIFLPLSDETGEAFESVIKTAASFLETQGAVERKSLGIYRRSGRSSRPDDVLHLVTLTTTAKLDPGDGVVLARAVEGVMRSTLLAAKIAGTEVRVLIAE